MEKKIEWIWKKNYEVSLKRKIAKNLNYVVRKHFTDLEHGDYWI